MVVLWNRLWLRAYELTLNYRIILGSVLRWVGLVKPKISAHDGLERLSVRSSGSGRLRQ